MIDPEVAHQRATIAAHSRWASEPNRTAATSALRAGFLAKLQREARDRLGPAATDEQVAAAAENALKAHYARMRLNSIQTRRRRAQERQQAAADELADAILSESPETAA
jgi:hypothetical protein